MRKKILMPLSHVGYYVLYLSICLGIFLVLIDTFLSIAGIGGLLYVDYLFLVATPVIVAILTRFSLLKWYVDPIAAAEVPIAIYILTKMCGLRMIVYDLVAGYHVNYGEDGGKSWLFFACLFVISLAASFSLARKRGESISYRAISKFLA